MENDEPGIQDDISVLISMLDERSAKLADEEKNLEERILAFETTQKIISSFKDPIKLNVGGTIFMTSKSTISKQESMLSAMFSGRHTLEKGKDGAYFIDRDPKHFGKILNFLRDDEFQMPKDETEIKEMLREAEYYSMQGLIEYLSEGIVETPDVGTSHNPTPTYLSQFNPIYLSQINPIYLSQFNPLRRGSSVIINGATASSNANYWQPAFTESFSTGVNACTFSWKSMNANKLALMMIGVTGANINHTAPNICNQPQSMMWHSSGWLYVAGACSKKLINYAPGSITVQLDCNSKTVTWIYGTNRFTEPLHPNLQAPFSFCVELHQSSATITPIL